MAPKRGTKVVKATGPANTDQDDLGLHLGESLFRFSNTYPTLDLTLVEATQNAIDADAEKVFIGVDFRSREIIVLDDGTGVTRDKFREALRSIGKGIKKSGSLGRFGLGLISPLTKCGHFTFASHPIGMRIGNVWRFEGEAIRKMHEGGQVPREQVEMLPPLPPQFVQVAGQLYARWRTIVHMVGVHDDKIEDFTDLDDLESDIRTKLSIGMIQKNTVVTVMAIGKDGKAETREINPLRFTGEKLKVFTHHEKGCGLVTFELHQAPKAGGIRRGIVLVRRSDDNSPIPWRDFVVQAMGSRKLPLVKEAFDALGSGYFEGVIHAENIVLDERRTCFVRGPVLNSLYVAIYAWYLTVGKALYESEYEARRDQRYQNLGEQSLRRVMSVLKDSNVFATLARRLHGVLPEGNDIRPLPSTDSRPKPGDPRQRSDSPRERVVANPPKPRERNPRHQPQGVTLQFAYEMLPQSNRLWEFTLDGVLTFNVRHPVWVKLDETGGKHTARNDRQIMHLQEWLAFKLLLLLEQYDDPGFELEVARTSVDKEVRYYAEMFIATIR
ncbi:MAG TPA: ATP-binding protein [Candidatus Saccharimonadales bacterium]|nr:ATP-binding protein [Candidatus Saccharimonadales bacterium]